MKNLLLAVSFLALLGGWAPGQTPAKGAIENVTLKVENTDIQDVILQLVGHGHANVVIGPEVRGAVSLDFVGIPWRRALESSVAAVGCHVEEFGGVLRVKKTREPGTRPKTRFTFEQADVRDVLSAIAKLARANIIVDPAVQGRVTIRMRDVPWQTALTATVETLGLELRHESSGIIRVVAGSTATKAAPRTRYSFERADAVKVISAISRIAGANIIVPPELRGQVTVQIQGVPWRVALAAVVETLGFELTNESRGILRVTAIQR